MEDAVSINPQVPTPVLVLDRHETIGDYARAYGDEIARVYEDDGIIFIPHFPIPLDLDFFNALTFPEQWKKIGVANGLTRKLFVRQNGKVLLDKSHPLFTLVQTAPEAGYLHEHMRATHAALLAGLSQLFPRYHSMKVANITWRCIETINEGMHLDGFSKGKALGTERDHRIKMFLNLDTLPRHWQISYNLMTALNLWGEKLPHDLPDDLNLVSRMIGDIGLWPAVPYHTVKFPQLSAVLANGESVAHNVVYGRRTIGLEFFVEPRDMLNPEKQPSRKLSRWIAENRKAN